MKHDVIPEIPQPANHEFIFTRMEILEILKAHLVAAGFDVREHSGVWLKCSDKGTGWDDDAVTLRISTLLADGRKVHVLSDHREKS